MIHIRTTQSLHNPDLCPSLGADSDTETQQLGDFTDNSSIQEDESNIKAAGVDFCKMKQSAEKVSKWHSGLAPPSIKRKYSFKP